MRLGQRGIGCFVLAVLVTGVSFVAGAAQRSSFDKSEPLLDEAAALFQKGDLLNAEAVLKKALAVKPRNVKALTLAGIVAERRNKAAEAERHFALAARVSPNSPETRNNYGAILFRLGRTKEAAREFEASLKANPNQSNALVNLAQIRFAENDYRTAQALFEKASALAPDSEVNRALTVVALKLNETARAADHYRKYAALKNTAFVNDRKEFGAALLNAGLTAEAAEELQSVVAAEPANVEANILLARTFLKQKDIKSAGRTLESAVARGVDDARIYAALSEVYETGGYIENAIPAMRLAIEKDARNEFYRVRYGMLLIDSKAPAAAIIRLQEAAKEFPNSARILLALGIAQQIEGKAADAQVSFENALKLEPRSVPVLAYLALIMDEKGQYAETVSMTERALAIDEKNPVLHYLLADTLQKMPAGDRVRIEGHLKKAIELDPKLVSAYLSLGRFYARENRWSEAAARFEQAVKLEPDLADAHYQLGRALSRLKRTEEAKPAFEKFKKLSETQTAAREATRRELVQRLANVKF